MLSSRAGGGTLNEVSHRKAIEQGRRTHTGPNDLAAVRMRIGVPE
jgi:hypothetical protein